MRKKVMKITSMFFLFFDLSVTFVLADGCFFSDEFFHLNQPDQRAVISRDGQTEEMILSSSVKSDEISNMAWIVPIQSSVKPEIVASDISVLKEVAGYFKERADNYMMESVGGKVGTYKSSVRVIESKEIDRYDITILKADDSTSLLNWIRENGYRGQFIRCRPLCFIEDSCPG